MFPVHKPRFIVLPTALSREKESAMTKKGIKKEKGKFEIPQ